MNHTPNLENHIRRVCDPALDTHHRTQILDADGIQAAAFEIRPRACEAVIEVA